MTKNAERFTHFRQQVYKNMGCRADSKMDLLDALCSHDHARSVVELSLTPAFRSHYSSIFQAIRTLDCTDEQLRQYAKSDLPQPSQLPFWLFAVDVTACPRQYAPTLQDRTYIHQPTPTPGQKPIAVGHQYSSVVLLPEMPTPSAPWVVPMAATRVESPEDKELVGVKQMNAIFDDDQLPCYQQLCVTVSDTAYSKPAALYARRTSGNKQHTVDIVRVRSNRVFYDVPPDDSRRWYGERFALHDPATWRPADETVQLQRQTARSRKLTVQLQAWHHLRMRGHRKPHYLPMHLHPFTLIRAVVKDAATGMPLFKRPLWFIVVGDRREEITLTHAYDAYLKRSHIEHFFRFNKQRLLMTRYQTPDVKREEQWWRLTHLAYLQLWVGRQLSDVLPKPWEQYLPTMKQQVVTPRTVQRDFYRLIRQLGTPAKLPKPRNRSSGRRRGQGRKRRPRYKAP